MNILIDYDFVCKIVRVCFSQKNRLISLVVRLQVWMYGFLE